MQAKQNGLNFASLVGPAHKE